MVLEILACCYHYFSFYLFIFSFVVHHFIVHHYNALYSAFIIVHHVIELLLIEWQLIETSFESLTRNKHIQQYNQAEYKLRMETRKMAGNGPE